MMRYSLLVLVLTALLATPLAPAAAQSETVRVFVDGQRVRFDQPPIVVGSRVLVPLRGIFEQMGATVDWEPATRTVVAVRDQTVVELIIGRRVATVNDRSVPLDVPAMVVRGRTLVPLRFISEAMGATVQYQDETRTVLIFSSGAGPGPGPAPAPAADTVKGTLTQIRTGENPRIWVEEGGNTVRVSVTPDTLITRVNLTTNRGGSVSLNALRIGDQIEATMDASNRAQRIRATFRTVLGRIDAIAGGGRTILLTNGQAYRLAPEDVQVIINDQPSTLANLKAGMIVALRLNPESNLVYGITAESATGGGTVTAPGRPVISTPEANAAISSPVTVSGIAEGVGAVKVVVTIDSLLGVRLGSTSSALNGNQFSASLSYQSLFSGWPYVITVVAVNTAGLESDPATVVVRQR